MKTNTTLSILQRSSCASGLVLILCLAQACTAVVSVHSTGTAKTRPSKKEREIKIYPDIIKKTMHVKNIENREVDFFVFDVEGTLMVHYKMNEGDHKRISGLEKGMYTYQVFMKDEMSESGKVIIK